MKHLFFSNGVFSKLSFVTLFKVRDILPAFVQVPQNNWLSFEYVYIFSGKAANVSKNSLPIILACCSATKGRKTDTIVFTGEKYRLQPVIGTSHL